jgi:DnaJ-class molecular chaperone
MHGLFEKNLYKVLQVDPEADQDVIAAAYKALAAKLHPERDISGVAEFRMSELNRAYQVLADPSKRSLYDLEIERVAIAVGIDEGPNGVSRGGSLAERVAAHSLADGDERLQIDFGRYTGYTLGELVRSDPEYLQWLSRHSSGIRFRGPIMRLLARRESEKVPLTVRPER